MARILIAGCGYVGARLAHLLVEDGDTAFGLKRSPDGLPPGVEPILADVTEPRSLSALPRELDAVVYAVSPSGGSEGEYRAAYVDGFRNVLDAVSAGSPGLNRTVLVSSTGAYGYTDGRWVDEETPPEPGSARGEILVEAEALAAEAPPSGLALRLGGIYGPGRTSTIRRVLTGLAGCPEEGLYSNRIHRDDAAAAVRHLLHLADPDALYVGVDREPAQLRDVYRWIAEEGGGPDPCRGDDGDAWEARGRRGTNKRCRSDRLVESGFSFHYPTYREGYGELLAESA